MSKEMKRLSKYELAKRLRKANKRIELIRREIICAVGPEPHRVENLTSWQMCHLNCALKE
jgi:hypothetical protein